MLSGPRQFELEQHLDDDVVDNDDDDDDGDNDDDDGQWLETSSWW